MPNGARARAKIRAAAWAVLGACSSERKAIPGAT